MELQSGLIRTASTTIHLLPFHSPCMHKRKDHGLPASTAWRLQTCSEPASSESHALKLRASLQEHLPPARGVLPHTWGVGVVSLDHGLPASTAWRLQTYSEPASCESHPLHLPSTPQSTAEEVSNLSLPAAPAGLQSEPLTGQPPFCSCLRLNPTPRP